MINDVVSVPWRLQNVIENHGGNYVLEKGSLLHVDKVALTQEMTNEMYETWLGALERGCGVGSSFWPWPMVRPRPSRND